MKEIVRHVLDNLNCTTFQLLHILGYSHSNVMDWPVDWRTEALEVPTPGFEFQSSFLHM